MRARASVVHRVRAFRDRTAVKRTAFTRRSRARGSPGTTEGVKNRHWGRMTYISYVPRVRVLHDGRRRPRRRVGRCVRGPWEAPNFVRVPAWTTIRDVGKPRNKLSAATKSGQSHKTGQHRHGGRSQPLARLRAAERPSHRCHRRRDPSRLRRCVSGARRLVRERTPRFFIRLVPCFPAAHLELGSDRPLPPPCPTASPQARTSCPRSRPSPRARWRTRVLPWLTPPASAARCTSLSASRDSTRGATRRCEI